MRATVGDRLHVHGRVVGDHDRVGVILEIMGDDGLPPYRVRFSDGKETIVTPGPDCVVEAPDGSVRV